MPCNNLKGEMAKKNVTIEEIAECLNVHRNSVANKINGRSKFSISEAFKIQKIFSLNWKLNICLRSKSSKEETTWQV